ncbi:MAG: 30S ribosomal protein S2 [Xanthomonadaceae bacterium]|nr:30S ribosomal protein S2 [Rhodospirillaceae bacterium]NIA17847.1 30S ribosomal protein S2 [Xanthomonadaceae bacterium]
MSKKIELSEMLKAGLHFGHSTSKWHPKMEPYIFTSRNGIHIINLEKTADCLEKALKFLRNLSSKGGVILFLGSKPQIKSILKQSALDAKMPYVADRWLGGTITNFAVIYKSIKKYILLKNQKEKQEWKKYKKKEQLNLEKELEKLEKKFGGIEMLKKIPDAIFIIDSKNEKIAIAEAKTKKIPIVALCDTNINPEGIDYVIPGNDDSIKGVQMILDFVVSAVKEGREIFEKNPV